MVVCLRRNLITPENNIEGCQCISFILLFRSYGSENVDLAQPRLCLLLTRRTRTRTRTHCNGRATGIAYEDAPSGMESAWKAGCQVIDVRDYDGYPLPDGLRVAMVNERAQTRSWMV